MIKISLTAGIAGLILLLWSVDFSTSQTGFCTSCHVMREFAILRHDSAHFKKSEQDISCVKCHLPQAHRERIPEKIRSGIKDIKVQISERPVMIEHFDDHHSRRKDFIYEQACISCHAHGLQSDNLLTGINEMHRHSLNHEEGLMSCLDCHGGMEHGRNAFFNWEPAKERLGGVSELHPDIPFLLQDIILKTCFACHSKRGAGLGNFNAFDYQLRPSDYYALKVGIRKYQMPPTPFLRDYALNQMERLEYLMEGQ